MGPLQFWVKSLGFVNVSRICGSLDTLRFFIVYVGRSENEAYLILR